MTAKKSVQHRVLSGTNRPSRSKQLPAAPAHDLGAPPPHLEPAVASTWVELAGMVPVGIGRSSDRPSFEMLAMLIAKMRSKGLSAAELAQARQLLDAYALSPRGRAAVDLAHFGPAAPSSDDFDF